jgi:putative ABC transport system permease protein
MGLDLRHALRRLARRPLATAVAVLTLAIGIGGATALFSVAHAVVLRPLPYVQPDRLVLLWQNDLERGQPFVEMSYPMFRDWSADRSVFEALAASPSTNQSWVLTGPGEPAHVTGRLVSWNFFDVLGVAPELGRTLRPEDDVRGAARVLVLGHALWQSRFAGDRGVVGRSVVLDGEAFTVVGVMPDSFVYPAGAQLWTPVVPGVPELAEQPGVFWMSGLGRLRPGLTLEQARRDMAAIATAYNREKHQAPHVTAVLTPFAEAVLGPTRPVLLALLAGVTLVLLVACANVAALQAVAADARAGELSVRMALGASRARLTRELILESLAVAVLGGCLGVGVAIATVPLLVALSPQTLPRLTEVGVSLPMLAAALGATTGAGLLTALAPAHGARRRTPLEALLGASRRWITGRSRFRSTLVAAEVAVALVLLVAAGLLIRSYRALHAVPLGYDPERLIAIDAGPPKAEYPTAADRRDFVDVLLARLRSLPEVDGAAAVTLRPLWGTVGMDWPFTIEGQSPDEAERNPLVNFETVTPDYFQVMRIALRRGRAFDERDREGRPGVVIVSQALARRYWPGQDPIGKRLKLPLPPTEYHDVWLTVVGVADDARYRELTVARLDIYMPYRQSDHPLHHVVVRSRRDTATASAAVARVMHDLLPGQPAPAAVAMTAAVAEATAIPRFAARVLSAFATTAVLLAAVGLYGLVAGSVARRTREIGMRVVLGASRAAILRLVAAETLRPVAAGVALGVAGAVAAGHMAVSLLFGVAPTDPATIATACGVFILVAAGASAGPTWRALRLPPAETLRES